MPSKAACTPSGVIANSTFHAEAGEYLDSQASSTEDLLRRRARSLGILTVCLLAIAGLVWGLPRLPTLSNEEEPAVGGGVTRIKLVDDTGATVAGLQVWAGDGVMMSSYERDGVKRAHNPSSDGWRHPSGVRGGE